MGDAEDKLPKFWPRTLLPLNKPAHLLWKLGSAFVVPAVGLFSKVWLNYMNTTKITNHQAFLESARNNYENKKWPLLTVCNHNSCLDDPLIWGTLFPTWWHLNSKRHRWSPAAEDICFTRKSHTVFFVLGKTFPVIRGEGIYQPAMNFAVKLLRQNEFVHVFPQGKVVEDIDINQPDILTKSPHEISLVDPEDAGKPYELKWGLARLILDTIMSTQSKSKVIEILPFYHIGMNNVLPNTKPYIPRTNNKVTIYFRDEGPILFDEDFIKNQCCAGVSDTTAEEKRIGIMRYMEKELKLLKLKAITTHKETFHI